MELTREAVRETFSYSDGFLFWRKGRKGRKVGVPAGTVNAQSGYVTLCVDYKRYAVHRIIYLYHHGHLPEQVDHIDGDRSNNRIENLRPATSTGNNCNRCTSHGSKSGVKNVYWSIRRKVYWVSVQVNRINHWGGTFRSMEEAIKAAEALRRELHGEFATRPEHLNRRRYRVVDSALL